MNTCDMWYLSCFSACLLLLAITGLGVLLETTHGRVKQVDAAWKLEVGLHTTC